MERTVTFSKCSVGKQNNYNVPQNEEKIVSELKQNVTFQKLRKLTFTLTFSASRFDSTGTDSTTLMPCEIGMFTC